MASAIDHAASAAASKFRPADTSESYFTYSGKVTVDPFSLDLSTRYHSIEGEMTLRLNNLGELETDYSSKSISYEGTLTQRLKNQGRIGTDYSSKSISYEGTLTKI